MVLDAVAEDGRADPAERRQGKEPQPDLDFPVAVVAFGVGVEDEVADPAGGQLAHQAADGQRDAEEEARLLEVEVEVFGANEGTGDGEEGAAVGEVHHVHEARECHGCVFDHSQWEEEVLQSNLAV